jgi:glucokinase
MIALGIDIGGSRIKAGLVDESGRITASSSAATPGDLDSCRESLLALVRELTLPVLAVGTPEGKQTPEAVLAARPLAGVGIGCKGIIHPLTTRVEVLPGALSFLEGYRLSKLLEEALPAGTLVVGDNDARAAMAGELAWGAAKGRSDVLMLTLGTGVGGGIVAGGRLLKGATGVAGHLGHVTVDPDGPPCICGNNGCLETYFSGHAIEAEALSVAYRGCASRLAALARQGPAALTCQAVFELASDGDELARRIVDRATRALGAALAGLLLVFDPEIVILGGQISEAGDSLFAALRQEVARRTRRMLRREVAIVTPQIGGQVGIIGAAALVMAAQAEAQP